MADAAKELKDLENIITDLEKENKALRKKLKAAVSYSGNLEALNRAMILMDTITRAVESKDDWAEDSAGAACRTFLSEQNFKTP